MNKQNPRYVVERRRGLFCVYDTVTGSKISSHIKQEEAYCRAKELNNNINPK